MKLGKENQGSQPKPISDLMKSIEKLAKDDEEYDEDDEEGDEEYDEDDEEGDEESEEGNEEDDEESEEQSEADFLRRYILTLVAYLYEDIKKGNPSEDKYSQQRQFIDYFVAPFVLIVALPDDEVEEQLTNSLAAIPHIIGELIADTLYNHIEDVVSVGDEKKIRIALDWRFYYIDSFRSKLARYANTHTKVGILPANRRPSRSKDIDCKCLPKAFPL